MRGGSGVVPLRRVSCRRWLLCLFVFFAAVLATSPSAEAKGGKGSRGGRGKTHLGGLDKEYYMLREECSKSEAVLGSANCTSSDVMRENCVLECVSPECYAEVYAQDPLEEGELDTTRGRLFRVCVRNAKKRREAERKQQDQEL